MLIDQEIILRGHGHIVVIGHREITKNDFIAHETHPRMGGTMMRRDTMGMKKVGKWALRGRKTVEILEGGAFGMRMI